MVVGKIPRIAQNFEWDSAQEAKFTGAKTASRKVFHFESHGNFNEIGLGNEIHQYLKYSKNNLKRDEILQRYMEGDWLTPDELRYMMLTSTCMEQFIQRNFFQNIVDILDEDFVEKIEVGIADTILDNYK